MANQTKQQQIHSGQISLVLKNSTASALGNALVALVFMLLFINYLDETQTFSLFIWFGSILMVSLIRWRYGEKLLQEIPLFRQASSHEPLAQQPLPAISDQDHKKVRLYYAMVLTTAALWGSASFLFFSTELITQTVLLVTVAGIIAGSLSSLAAVKPLFITFLLLALTPLEIQLFLNQEPQSLTLAMMVLLYALFMYRSGMYHQQMVQEILSLNLENRTLIKELTEAKNKAEEAVTVKSNFLSNVSHELRTPLNAILGFTTILKQNEKDAQKLYYQEIIDESSHNLLNIINDILDLSKIENHQLKTRQKPCKIQSEIDAVVHQQQKNADKKQVRIDTDYPAPIPETLLIDCQHWKQILSNLLSNAVKFSGEKTTVTIEIEFSSKTQMLKCRVIDQGIGISEEDQQKIFDSFTQAEEGLTRSYGGTGLGLTICKHLTEHLGGKLSLISKLGEGSQFFFEIPAKTLRKTDETKNSFASLDIKGHILIVEDNLANQLLLKSLISRMGLTYDTANDGVEAVEKFQQNHYDLVLMDESMPRLNGTAATQKIRSIEAEHFKDATPIIAVTANAGEDDRQHFLESGMDDYISKPIDVDKLTKSLQRFLSTPPDLS